MVDSREEWRAFREREWGQGGTNSLLTLDGNALLGPYVSRRPHQPTPENNPGFLYLRRLGDFIPY